MGGRGGGRGMAFFWGGVGGGGELFLSKAQGRLGR